MAIATFNERISAAVEIVSVRFPNACLLMAEGRASTGPTTLPRAIDSLIVLFRDDDGTVLATEETGRGEFGPLCALAPSPDLGPPINWPTGMDLHAADHCRQEAVHVAPYATVILRARQDGEAEFVFGGTPDGGFDVIVDSIDGTVRKIVCGSATDHGSAFTRDCFPIPRRA